MSSPATGSLPVSDRAPAPQAPGPAAPEPQASTPRIATSVPALLAWAGFALLVLYAVLLGGSWIGIYDVRFRIVSLAIIAVALAAWALVAWRRPEWRPRSAIWPTLVLPIAALTAATIGSRLPRLGVEYVAWAVLLVALYLFLVRILALPYSRARIGVLAAMLGLVIGGIYLGLVTIAWLDWWQLIGGLDAPPLRPHTQGLTYRNPNAVATVTTLLAFIAWAGLDRGAPGRRVLLSAVGLVTLLTVVVSGSRSAWLASAGTAAIVGGSWFLLAVRAHRWRRPRMNLRTALIVVGLVLASAALLLVLVPSIGSRLLDSGDGGRPVYFATAVRMFQEAPLLGTGPGTWAVQRAAYTRPGELDWYVTHAHDMYLQTLAESGIAGALCGVIAAAVVAWLVWRAISQEDRSRGRWGWAALASLGFLGIVSLVDSYANMPAVIFLGAVPVAILDATAAQAVASVPRRPAWRPRLAASARAAFWLLSVAAIAVLARTEALAADHSRAVALINAGDWEAARPIAEAVAAADPDLIAYQVTRGLAAAEAGEWQAAADAFGRAAGTDDLPASWLGLAQAQLASGAPEADVVGSLERALRIGAQQPGILYAAADLYDRLGMPDEADASYAAAVASLPGLAADPLWRSDPSMRQRFPGILAEAIVRAGSDGWWVALMAGESERAAELADGLDSGGDARLVVRAWGGDADAAAELQDRALRDPQGSRLLAWAGLVAARAGEADTAARLRALAIFNWEGGELPGYLFGRASPGVAAVPAGTRGAYYGQWLYRRPLPVRQLAPGLQQIVYVGLGREGATRDGGE